MAGGAGLPRAERPAALSAPDDVAADAPPPRALLAGLSVLLVGLVALAFAHVGDNGFVTYDDPGYLRRNTVVQQGLTADGVGWAFTTYRMANWHPLTWVSHMVDVELFGMRPRGHHLMSAGLHALNAVLLLWALARLGRRVWPAALAAALFAVHPLRVESVAWASERKDVLAGTFFMRALLAYGRLRERPDDRQAVGWSAVWMAFGLLAKPMLVTLPFVLLLLDVWPLRRLRLGSAGDDATGGAADGAGGVGLGRLLVEKLPHFALAAASSVVTVLAQSAGGAVSSLEALPLAERLANVAVAYVGYLRMAVWPTELAFYYPFTAVSTGAAAAATGALLLASVVLVVAGLRRGAAAGWLAVGWLWFVGMLVPVIGVVQVGSQALADRYAYLPLVGLSLLPAWGLAALARRGGAARGAAVALGLALVAACVPLTRAQVGVWRNTRSLCEHALALSPDIPVAHMLLATSAQNREEWDRAREHLEAAVALQPDYARARVAYALLLLRPGAPLEGLDEAARRRLAGEQLEAAVRLDDGDDQAWASLAEVRAADGDRKGALEAARRARELAPGDPAHEQLLARLRRDAGR